jgi:hypothetical protein
MIRYFASLIATVTIVAAQVATIETTVGSVKGRLAPWPQSVFSHLYNFRLTV